MSEFPKIFRVRQEFERPRVNDVARAVHEQLSGLDLGKRTAPGRSVAVAVGSRGIAQLAAIVRAIVEHLKSLRLRPFIVPAMGSHGGGTAEGQRSLLESYGVSEAFCACPIRSSTETVVVGEAAGGLPIHFDRLAYEADHTVVCNRIKPHTIFVGPFESGLLKMLLIGLGNGAGALVYHRAIDDFSFEEIIRRVAPVVIEKCRVLAGVAIVENAYDETAMVEAVAPEEFLAREPALLTMAREWMPRLPFTRVDVLLIDRIGKNISGLGMDSNVVGRKFNDHKAMADEWPKVKRICVRGLSAESRGNAVGLGLAEFCRSSLLSEIDIEATRLNTMTSGHISAGMIPPDYATDRQMLAAASSTVGLAPPDRVRLMWIADTLHVGQLECSEAYLAEARGRSDLEVVVEPRPLPFDEAGNLP